MLKLKLLNSAYNASPKVLRIITPPSSVCARFNLADMLDGRSFSVISIGTTVD